MTKEEAIEILSDMRAEYNIFSDDEKEATRYHALSWAIQALNERTERKKGRWKRAYLDHEAMGERPSILYCSVCNQCIAYPVNYCPNCGADMRGEQDE